MYLSQHKEHSNAVVERRWETVQVSLLLLILLAIFFGRAIFLGYKLVPADIAYTDPVYLAHAPAEFTTPHNVLLYDQAYQFYPWRVYATQAVQRGFLPFWNPFVYCGAPLMAEDQPAVLYPVNILTYAISPPDAVLISALARLFIAGLATYWFARTIGAGKFGALISTVAFTFSGFMIVWLGHPHTNVAAWLPAFFLTLEWLHRSSSARHVALAALVVAAQLTGGHAETALYTLTAGGLYYLFRTVAAWWSKHAPRDLVLRLVSFCAAVVLGFALASTHLVPFVEWLQYSAELQFRTGVGGLRATRLGPRYWLAGLLPTLLPNIFNNPTWPGEYRSFLPGWNFVEQTLYVGVISLTLAACALVGRRRDKQTWLIAALGLIALGAALRVPVFDWLNHLPLFNIAAYGRLRLIYSFCVALLAGLGAQETLGRPRKDSMLRMAIGGLLACVLVGAILLLTMPGILSAMNTQAAAPYARQLSPDMLSSAFSVSNVAMHWPLLIALAGVLMLVLYQRDVAGQRTMQTLLLLLVLVDLFALGVDYHAAVPEEWVFPETPALRLLKSDKDIFRVVGTNIDLMPNSCIINGLQDVRGLAFPGHRYQELCLAMGGRDWLGYGILFTESLQPRLLGLMNVKYVLSSSQLGPDSLRHLRLVDEDKDIKIYENLSCFPRAFVVHSVRICKDRQEVLQLLQDPGFDLGATIVLEKPAASALAGLSDDSPRGQAEITSYQPNRVEIRADTTADGVLFLSDSYYPGWRAYVDGIEAEIYQANYAFRAVYLTPGQHKVEFIYEPSAFRAACTTTLLASIGVVVLAVSSWPRKHDEASTGL